jgi:S-adenosyl-L-methionine hydrolase (adenosine-forming)
MIALFTDFGAEGPYLGQMISVLDQEAPDTKVINLLSDAPTAEPRLSAYLLAALSQCLPQGTVFLCVVDPGVGGTRLPIALEADGRWFVGPDNGLFNTVSRQTGSKQWWTIEWQPDALSSSFHGRDLFAPVAARIAQGTISGDVQSYPGPDVNSWPADIETIVYIDHYGNAMTGCRKSSATANEHQALAVNGHLVLPAKTFSAVPKGQPFWYENSCGLIEIAVNSGRADELLRLAPGVAFHWQPGVSGVTE